MLALAALLYLTAIAGIIAFFRACAIREMRQQRAQQQADRQGVSFIHSGAK